MFVTKCTVCNYGNPFHRTEIAAQTEAARPHNTEIPCGGTFQLIAQPARNSYHYECDGCGESRKTATRIGNASHAKKLTTCAGTLQITEQNFFPETSFQASHKPMPYEEWKEKTFVERQVYIAAYNKQQLEARSARERGDVWLDGFMQAPTRLTSDFK